MAGQGRKLNAERPDGGGICKALVRLEHDEGPDIAKVTAENWQYMLEGMQEATHDKREKEAIRTLLWATSSYLKSRVIIMPY